MSKLTWDNAVLIGPKMADREGIKTMDVVTLELGGRKVTGPVWIQAGHPDHSVTVHLGYGRRKAGRAGTGAGFDAYASAHHECALDRNRRQAHQDRRLLSARFDPGLPDHGYGRRRDSSAGSEKRRLRNTARSRSSLKKTSRRQRSRSIPATTIRVRRTPGE